MQYIESNNEKNFENDKNINNQETDFNKTIISQNRNKYKNTRNISNNFNRLKSLMTPEELNNIKLQCIEIYKKGGNADDAQEKFGVSKKFFYDSIRIPKKLEPEDYINKLLNKIIKKEERIKQLEKEQENILKEINKQREILKKNPINKISDLFIITTTKLKGNRIFKTIDIPPEKIHYHYCNKKKSIPIKKKPSFFEKIFRKNKNKSKRVNKNPEVNNNSGSQEIKIKNESN